jgi:hypothetical protein
MSGHPGCRDDRIPCSIEEGLDLMDRQQVDQIIEDLLVLANDWKLIIFDTQPTTCRTATKTRPKTSRQSRKRCSGSPTPPAQQSVSCTIPAGTTQGSAAVLGSARLWTL